MRSFSIVPQKESAQKLLSRQSNMTISITFGNTARKLRRERWEWLVYVKPHGGNKLKRVSIVLHPSFRTTHYDLEKNNDGIYHSLKFKGWGTFTVLINIHFDDHNAVQLAHDLVFERGGSQSTVEVEAPKTNCTASLSRKAATSRLQHKPYTEHYDPTFWHGRFYTGPQDALRVVWSSKQAPRPDHDSPLWLTATEYNDSPLLMDSKIDHLAHLLTVSRKTIIYSGAGISRAAGIGQAARGSGKGGGNKSTTALPTFTHYALTALEEAGYIESWVQQNHDGLPQKAGFRQELINEIHGSWYDPSNPVVVYSGTLKDEQMERMLSDAKSADLVLVLGTTLGGLNADQVALKCAKRSLSGKSLGMVIVNLQQTQHDGKATLRMFGESDDILVKLLTKLEISLPNALEPRVFGKEPLVLVPYDANGKRSSKVKMWLDLRASAQIKLTAGHNIQGSQQPAYMHIEGPTCCPSSRPARGHVRRWNSRTCAIELEIGGVGMNLGQWWVEAAIRGGPRTLPIVNVNPEMFHR